jgi:GH24 family phage-related lysozyme (muramidase)
MPKISVAKFYQALWRRREVYRYKKWQRAKKGSPERSKWFRLYHEAHLARIARDAQVKKLTPPSERFTHVSDAAVELIKEFEGFFSHPYRDPVGVWTIGYGHIENVGPNTPPITKAQAHALLKRDLDNKYAPSVAKSGRWTQAEGDALTSFVYNLGTGSIAGAPGFESMTRAIRGGNRQQIANAMLKYDHAGGRVLLGLTRRRREEAALFLKG